MIQRHKWEHNATFISKIANITFKLFSYKDSEYFSSPSAFTILKINLVQETCKDKYFQTTNTRYSYLP